MKILVTGRHGQLARSLAERAGGHELVFAGRPELNLADAGSIERTVAGVHPELIVSAAAYTAVDHAEDEPELAMRVNGEAPAVLARMAASIGARLIHLSTDYVFNGDREGRWREEDPVDPINAYGASKLAGEQRIAASQAEYVVVRTGWVYSPFGQNFVRTVLRLAESRDELQIVNDQYGCPTSALDIADGILAIAERWRADPRHGIRETYHLAGPDRLHRADFAREILAQSHSGGGPMAKVTEIPSSAFATRAKRPRNSALDSSKFAYVFGYRAPRLQASLKPVVARRIRRRPTDE